MLYAAIPFRFSKNTMDEMNLLLRAWFPNEVQIAEALSRAARFTQVADNVGLQNSVIHACVVSPNSTVIFFRLQNDTIEAYAQWDVREARPVREITRAVATEVLRHARTDNVKGIKVLPLRIRDSGNAIGSGIRGEYISWLALFWRKLRSWGALEKLLMAVLLAFVALWLISDPKSGIDQKGIVIAAGGFLIFLVVVAWDAYLDHRGSENLIWRLEEE